MDRRSFLQALGLSSAAALIDPAALLPSGTEGLDEWIDLIDGRVFWTFRAVGPKSITLKQPPVQHRVRVASVCLHTSGDHAVRCVIDRRLEKKNAERLVQWEQYPPLSGGSPTSAYLPMETFPVFWDEFQFEICQPDWCEAWLSVSSLGEWSRFLQPWSPATISELNGMMHKAMESLAFYPPESHG